MYDRYLSESQENKISFLREEIMKGEVPSDWNPYTSADHALQVLHKLRENIRLELRYYHLDGEGEDRHSICFERIEFSTQALYRNNYNMMDPRQRMSGVFVRGVTFAQTLSDTMWEMMSYQWNAGEVLNQAMEHEGE